MTKEDGVPRPVGNVFVLCAGSAWSRDFSRACEHIAGFMVGLGSRARLLGEDRFAYPEHHIEVDDRLGWLLGDLGRRFSDDATLYVHVRMDLEEVVDDLLGRWDIGSPSSMIRAFGHGIIERQEEWNIVERRRVVETYARAFDSNVADFVKTRRSCELALDEVSEWFADFVDLLDVDCDIDKATHELESARDPLTTRAADTIVSPQVDAVAAGRAPLRIRHVIPVVGKSAPAGLREAQAVTLESIDVARSLVPAHVSVQVVGARFDDEDPPAGWLVDAPCLTRSSAQVFEFRVQRRLPLLADVLSGLGDPDDFDIAVYSNIDIGVQPNFYRLVAEFHENGVQSYTINRRDVFPSFGSSSPQLTQARLGAAHPGHDCFVFPAVALPDLDVGRVLLGVPYVARALLVQLWLRDAGHRSFHDLVATFHLGADEHWKNPALLDYERFNRSEFRAMLERAGQEFGMPAVRRLFGATQVLDRTDAEIDAAPRRPRQLAIVPSRPLVPRLIFCAASGRSGTGFLAHLLGACPEVDGGHERKPMMVGPFLEMATSAGLVESAPVRRLKIRAIEAEISRLRHDEVYADTSHMFIKTFADVVFDRFEPERLSVVALRRNPIDVAHSFYQLGYFSLMSDPWIDWMSMATAPNSSVGLDPSAVSSQFDLIFGYLAEIEELTARFRRATPGVTWVDARLEDIGTSDGARVLLGALELKTPHDLDSVVSNPVNDRRDRKHVLQRTVDRETVVGAFESFVERFGDRSGVQALLQTVGAER